jgi:hypothetical protein
MSAIALSLAFLLLTATSGTPFPWSDIPPLYLRDAVRNLAAEHYVLAGLFGILAGPLVTPVFIWVLRVCRPGIVFVVCRVIMAAIDVVLRRVLRWVLTGSPV